MLMACALPVGVLAQQTYSADISADGSSYKVDLTPADSAVNKIVLSFTSYSDKPLTNSSMGFSASVDAPANTKVSVEVTPLIQGAFPGQPYLSPLTVDGKKFYDVLSVPGSSAANSSSSPQTSAASFCDFLGNSAINSLIQIYSEMLCTTVTKQQLCSGNLPENACGGGSSSGGSGGGSSGGGSGSGSSGGAGISFSGLIFKNSCVSDWAYQVRVVIDRSAVDASLISNGMSLTVSIKEVIQKIKGMKLKKKSDGKINGPIFLGDHPGNSYSTLLLHLVTWSANGIKKIQTIKQFENFVPYNGMLLGRFSLVGKLKGGKATFVTHDRFDEAYSACFKMKAKTQTKGPYKQN